MVNAHVLTLLTIPLNWVLVWIFHVQYCFQKKYVIIYLEGILNIIKCREYGLDASGDFIYQTLC